VFYSILKGHPLEIEDGEDGSKSVTVELAQNADGRISALSCNLAPTAVGDELFWEFSFSIEVFSLDNSFEPFSTQDRSMAAPYIPSDVRPMAMTIVCKSLSALIRHVQPRRVFWVTKERELPEKALRKYDLLTQTLENAGYSVREVGTDPYGRRFCSMELA